jgi:DNA-binding GntR family transcriptional regulator
MQAHELKPHDVPGKLVRKTTVQLVVDELRDRILSGNLAPGLQLRQEALAAELGVSRIPVREAINLLSAEGFIDVLPHYGATVSMISVNEVRELFELRLRLEPWLLALACDNWQKDDLTHAASLVEQMGTASDSQWGTLNWQFHEALYRPAARPSALAIVRSLHDKSERYFRLQVLNSPIRDQAHDEHLKILKACQRNDGPRVARLIEQHVELAANQICQIVERVLASVGDAQQPATRRAAA